MITNNDSVIETIFTNNIDELLHLASTKQKLIHFVVKNFRENVHYIILKNIHITDRGSGGRNKIVYMVTKNTLELTKNTFNLKHRYIRKIGESQHINILMSLENQTIGFIENSYKNAIDVVRQKGFKNELQVYRVDLYFPSSNLIVECDENNHQDRDIIYEEKREKYILSLGNIIIRFNPNDKLFELSIVFQEINKILFLKEKKSSVVIIVNFDK
jgi:very-short-patch-repair endonuclease